MSGRNPDLPILDELGAEFEAMARSAVGAGADRHTARRRIPTGPSPRARERRAQAGRIGRRTTIVLVLVCLIGGVALAARFAGGGSGNSGHTAPALLGRAGNGAWSFSAYRDEGRLCTVFVPRGGELDGRCGSVPGVGHLRAVSAIVDGRRYVFGIAGAGVARIAASLHRPTGPTAAAAAREPVDRGAADQAGLPAADRWFVVDLGPVHGSGLQTAPAILVPLARGGRRAGPAYADCSLGILGAACKRRIEAAAAATR
jgi:hypothetical protein